MKMFLKIMMAILALIWAVLVCCGLFSTLWFLTVLHERWKVVSLASYRKWFTGFQSWFSVALLGGVRLFLWIRVDIDTDGLDLSRRHASIIMLPNHVWLGDPLFVYWALRKVGRTDITWVMKDSLERTPFGWAAKKMGAVFVGRNGGDDLLKVRSAAQRAREQGFVLLIFPEGTRRKTVPLGSRHRHLLDEKTGGVLTAAEVLPHAPFLVQSTHWSGGDQDLSPGRTAWEFLVDIANLFGRTVTVRLRLHEREAISDPKRALRDIWGEMDNWIEEREQLN